MTLNGSSMCTWERLLPAVDDQGLVVEPELVPDEAEAAQDPQQVEHVAAGQQVLDHPEMSGFLCEHLKNLIYLQI